MIKVGMEVLVVAAGNCQSSRMVGSLGVVDNVSEDSAGYWCEIDSDRDKYWWKDSDIIPMVIPPEEWVEFETYFASWGWSGREETYGEVVYLGKDNEGDYVFKLKDTGEIVYLCDGFKLSAYFVV